MPRPSIYRVSPKALTESALLTQVASIPEMESMFVLHFLKLAQAEGEFDGLKKITTSIQASGITVSQARVNQINKKLKSLGVLIDGKELNPQIMMQQNYVTLKSIRVLVNYYAKKEFDKPVATGRVSNNTINDAVAIIKSRNSGMFLDIKDSNAQNRIDHLFCILDSAMKSSGKDVRKKITVEYYFNKSDYVIIDAVTTTADDDDIAHLSDQRAIRVINGFYKAQIEAEIEKNSNYIADGLLQFDLHDLMKKMGLSLCKENKKISRDMVRRLASTEFIVDASNSRHFRAEYGADKKHFRYLSEFGAVNELECIDPDSDLYRARARFYQVRLHSDIVKNLLLPGRVFLSHPNLSRERAGLAHRLNNWCKAVVGVRPADDKNLVYTIDQLHDKVHPASIRANFIRDFLQLMQRDYNGEWDESGLVQVSHYGYLFQLTHNREVFSERTRRAKLRMPNRSNNYFIIGIMRDTTDPFVGDDSDHNKALRDDVSRLYDF